MKNLIQQKTIQNSCLTLKFLDKFGEVYEITGQTWTQEVNQAGDDIWVIVQTIQEPIVLEMFARLNLDPGRQR